MVPPKEPGVVNAGATSTYGPVMPSRPRLCDTAWKIVPLPSSPYTQAGECVSVEAERVEGAPVDQRYEKCWPRCALECAAM